jgi:hypothetical protein
VPGGEFVALNDQRVRSMRAHANLREMESAVRRGNVANLTGVRTAWSDQVLMTKARLLAIPPRLSKELLGEESVAMMQAKIEKSMKDVLNQLADDRINYEL